MGNENSNTTQIAEKYKEEIKKMLENLDDVGVLKRIYTILSMNK